MDPPVHLLLAGAVLLLVIVRHYLAHRDLRKVKGPPSPSWWMGESIEYKYVLQRMLLFT